MSPSKQLALCALISFGCGTRAPTVFVEIAEPSSGPRLADLVRLRLVVELCDLDEPVFAADLGDDMTQRFEVEVAPGEVFSVRVEGWTGCEDMPCVPEDRARTGDCRCFGELIPPKQRVVTEACTDWVRAEDDLGPIVLTLVSAGRCPLERPEGCNLN